MTRKTNSTKAIFEIMHRMDHGHPPALVIGDHGIMGCEHERRERCMNLWDPYKPGGMHFPLNSTNCSAPGVRFSAMVGKEPEVEVALD